MNIAAALSLLVPLLALGAAPGERRAIPSGGSCVRLDQIVTRTAPSDRVLEVEVIGGQRFRNTLPAPCPHLTEIDRFYTLRFESFGGERVCAGDGFRVIEPRVVGPNAARSFPLCRLGAFEELPRRARR